MLGVVWTPVPTNDRLAPTVPVARYPVAGAPVGAHVVDALGPVVDEVVAVTADADVAAAFASAGHEPTVVSPRNVPGAVDIAGHDAVLVAPATTYAESPAFASLADRAAPASLTAADADSAPLAPERTPRVVPVGTLREATGFEDVAAVLRERPPEGTAVVPADHLYDVARPWELLAANERAFAGLERAVEGDVHPDADCRGSVVVREGASVDAGVVLEGPALVCRGVEIGPNAYVRKNSYLGTNAHVGHAAELKQTVLFSRGRVPHLAYVGDSVIGPDANLGAGSVVANLRHDGEDVRATHGGELVTTGRRKFGAVVGAGARLGIGTCVNAGVTLPPEATTTPNETVLRDVEVTDA